MRVTTRITSAVLATLLAAAAMVALAELALAALGRDPWLVDWRSALTFGQEHSWNDSVVRLIAIALLAAGALLLITALRPRPAVVVDSEAGTEHVRLRVRTRSLERFLDRELRRVDGVAAVTSRWSAKGLTVRITTRRSSPAGLRESVRARAVIALNRLGIHPEGLHVHVRSTAERPPPAPATDQPRAALEDHPPIAEDQATPRAGAIR
ncbi:MAG: DUF6286 domain-containing protein [Acidimicrobiales bacterium]